MKALILEPTRLFQQILCKMCDEHSLKPVIVESGTEAARLLEKRKFDLLIMSMYLPDMEGPELCMKLRAKPRTVSLPVVIITSEATEEQYQMALVSGATEVFNKSEIAQLSIYLEGFERARAHKATHHGRIIYVEDDKAVGKFTQALLTGMGYSVDWCQSAEEAFELYLKTQYDLIITDIFLKGKLTGMTLVSEVRKLPGRQGQVPMLTMSGQDDQSRKVELFHRGANDYVAKPVLEEELKARVNNLIINRQLLDKVAAQQEHLREIATHDQLTGIHNRHYLMDIGPRKVAEAYRHGFDLSMVVLDIDHFKKINDTHGHSVGDEVLSAIGKLLKKVSRAEDVCARFGGEEFVMMLSHCKIGAAMRKAESIRKKAEKLTPSGIPITISFGVSYTPAKPRVQFSDLFDAADEALYKAKQSGRNCVIQAETITQTITEQKVTG